MAFMDRHAVPCCLVALVVLFKVAWGAPSLHDCASGSFVHAANGGYEQAVSYVTGTWTTPHVGDMVVNANGDVFLTTISTGDIFIIAGTDQTISKLGDGASFPSGIAISPDESLVYVADQNGQVYAMDTSAGPTAARTNLVTGLSAPHGVILNGAGDTLWVACFSSPYAIARIYLTANTASVTSSDSAWVSGSPLTAAGALALSGDETTLYVTNDGNVVTVDTTSGAMTTLVALGITGTRGIILAGNFLYIGCVNCGQVTQVDIRDLSVSSLYSANYGSGMGISRDKSTLLVASQITAQKNIFQLKLNGECFVPVVPPVPVIQAKEIFDGTDANPNVLSNLVKVGYVVSTARESFQTSLLEWMVNTSMVRQDSSFNNLYCFNTSLSEWIAHVQAQIPTPIHCDLGAGLWIKVLLPEQKGTPR